MAKIDYLNKRGLATVLALVKRGQTGVYVVKGRAIFADEAFLNLSAEDKEAIATGASSIATAGLYQYVDNAWVQVDTSKVEEGYVYDVINSFTTDSAFREGANHLVDKGTNIVVVNTGTVAEPVLKWDLFSGVLDLDRYQTKKLTAPLDIFSNETPAVYTASADLPTSEPKDTATIANYSTAILGDGSEKGDVYRALVAADPSDETRNSITWVKLGDQETVEGALELLGNTAANTPITDEEIIELWENA